MKTLLRSLAVALLGALVILVLSRAGTLRAQGGTDTLPPAAPPPTSTQPPAAPRAASPAASTEDTGPAPGDRISADNNVTFPVDI
ncbi:MAG TPA: hypothetical protein VGO41_11985 [Steroidobacteraceae bacterium]|jgi:hypothetical protein|nr:hypothetical protein [Steroidobacteraceae bacterium]